MSTVNVLDKLLGVLINHKNFFTTSIGNLQEASIGQLAVQKAKLADVRSFGQMMVKDHIQAEQQLLQLAKSRGYNLPAAATGGIQPDLNLKNAGADFDRLYVHGMLAGQKLFAIFRQDTAL